MGKKGEKSSAKPGGAGKGRAHNDSRSQAPSVIIYANRVTLRSDSTRNGGAVIADSLTFKKKKKEGKNNG